MKKLKNEYNQLLLVKILSVIGLFTLGYFAAMANLDADINVVSNGKIHVEYFKTISQEIKVNGETKTVTSQKEVDEELSLDCGKMSLKECDAFYNQMDETLGKPKLEAHIKTVLGLNQKSTIRIY